jgi:hypothetical protein
MRKIKFVQHSFLFKKINIYAYLWITKLYYCWFTLITNPAPVRHQDGEGNKETQTNCIYEFHYKETAVRLRNAVWVPLGEMTRFMVSTLNVIRKGVKNNKWIFYGAASCLCQIKLVLNIFTVAIFIRPAQFQADRSASKSEWPCFILAKFLNLQKV